MTNIDGFYSERTTRRTADSTTPKAIAAGLSEAAIRNDFQFNSGALRSTTTIQTADITDLIDLTNSTEVQSLSSEEVMGLVAIGTMLLLCFASLFVYRSCRENYDRFEGRVVRRLIGNTVPREDNPAAAPQQVEQTSNNSDGSSESEESESTRSQSSTQSSPENTDTEEEQQTNSTPISGPISIVARHFTIAIQPQTPITL